MSSPTAILLSALPGSSALRLSLQASGFVVNDHTLGSATAIDFEQVAIAIIEVGTRPDAAAGQSRRWRIELGNVHIPVVWVLPAESNAQAVLALDSGADLCLALPLEPDLLAAQVRALTRLRTATLLQTSRAAEARLLGDQLQKAQRDLDLTVDLARRVQRGLLPRTFPEEGSVRFHVFHRPRSRAGGDFYGVEQLDHNHIAFYLADTSSPLSAVGSLVGLFARQAAAAKDESRLVPPDEVLKRVNRELLSLGLEDPPIVAMLYGVIDMHTGDLTYARAGLPLPVHLPAAGESAARPAPGPYLGVFNAEYPPRRFILNPGDRLILGTDGTRPGSDADAVGAGDEFSETLSRHRELRGQEYLDAVARDLLTRVAEPDDFTLMVVERI